MGTLWRYPAVPDSVPHARATTRDAVRRHVGDGRTLHAILLCVTEAVTNVVVHAYRDGPPGEVEIEARRPNGYLCLYVRDSGRGMAPRSDSPGLGLGLGLIGDLSSDFAVRRCASGVGTEVAMRFELHPDAVPLSVRESARSPAR